MDDTNLIRHRFSEKSFNESMSAIFTIKKIPDSGFLIYLVITYSYYYGMYLALFYGRRGPLKLGE